MPKGIKGFQKGHTLGKANAGRKRPDVVKRNKILSFKGDEAEYSAKHKWINRNYGSPRYCEFCKRSNLNKRQYNWANIDHKYKRVETDWIRLCVSCHRFHDIKKGLLNY